MLYKILYLSENKVYVVVAAVTFNGNNVEELLPLVHVLLPLNPLREFYPFGINKFPFGSVNLKLR